LASEQKTDRARGVKQLVEELGENPEIPEGATIFKKDQEGEV
jgi:hypothetical protein